MFITFEGGEGCGKSTHSKILKKYLEGRGYKVVRTFEPGATPAGKIIRKMLLKDHKFMSKYAELFLFAADRMEHVERVIKPALQKNRIVISDRYIDSTTAYQSGGRGLPQKMVEDINKISSQGIVPDLTFLLDIPPLEGLKRGTKYTCKDKFESEKIGFHDKVRSMYLELAKKNKGRIKLISSLLPLEEVKRKIRKVIDEKLGN